MAQSPRILYCHCAYAQVIPRPTKDAILDKLISEGVAFDAVPDLCEMSARRDPALKDLAGQAGLTIVACFPRAVKWLFSAAGVELPEGQVEILNMRTQTPEEVFAVLGPGFKKEAL